MKHIPLFRLSEKKLHAFFPNLVSISIIGFSGKENLPFLKDSISRRKEHLGYFKIRISIFLLKWISEGPRLLLPEVLDRNFSRSTAAETLEKNFDGLNDAVSLRCWVMCSNSTSKIPFA